MCTLDDETIPDHSFETKIIKGKIDAMKGKTRETVSLIIGNHIFRKRNSFKNKDSAVIDVRSSNLSNICMLLHHSEDHHCWVDGMRPRLSPSLTSVNCTRKRRRRI